MLMYFHQNIISSDNTLRKYLLSMEEMRKRSLLQMERITWTKQQGGTSWFKYSTPGHKSQHMSRAIYYIEKNEHMLDLILEWSQVLSWTKWQPKKNLNWINPIDNPFFVSPFPAASLIDDRQMTSCILLLGMEVLRCHPHYFICILVKI